MTLSLMLSFALQAALLAPSIVAEFRALCLDTQGDVATIGNALTERGGWSAPSRVNQLTFWSRDDTSNVTVLAGNHQDGPIVREVCMVSASPDQAVQTALLSALGPYSAAVNAEGGLYIFAPSADAFQSRDVTFVQISTTAEKTTLTAVRSHN